DGAQAVVEAGRLEAGLHSDLAEPRVAMLVAADVEVKAIAHTGVVVGKAGGRAGDRHVDVRVAGDEEVGPPVPVHVTNRSPRVPAVRADSGRTSPLRERAVAVVPEQLVVPRCRHEEI